MAETTADVRRDIEMTRDRISETLQQLEQKTNVMQIVRDHPWPAIAVAMGAGALLAGSGSDIKAAAVTASATRGASSKVGNVLDEMVAHLMGGLSSAVQGRIEGLVNELKQAIGAPSTPGTPTTPRGGDGAATRSAFASTGATAGSPSYAASAGPATGSGLGTGSGVGTTGGAGMSASAGGASGGWAPQSADAMRAD